jgi:hypothetical protein
MLLNEFLKQHHQVEDLKAIVSPPVYALSFFGKKRFEQHALEIWPHG